MTKIILIRHGQDEDNYNKILNGHRDTKLTDLGKEQAKIVAEKLKDDNVEIILTSPLKRAMETASIISNELKISEIQTEELLKERNFGILTGKPLSDIPKLAKKVLPVNDVNYFIEADGAEDFPNLYKRAQSFLDKISKEYPDKVIVAVTHGDIGKIIRAVYHNWTWEEGLQTPSFENTGVLHLGDKDKLE
jgi:uncharacterized phosphatase